MAQYDKIATDYAKVKAKNRCDEKCFYPRFYDACGDVVGVHALDLATGDGRIARELLRRGAASVAAVDESEAMLKIARRQADSITYRRVRVGEMGKIGEFQLITAGWLMHYAQNEQQLVDMAEDIAVNLSRYGTFVALNANPSAPIGGSSRYGYFVTCVRNPPKNGDMLTVRCFSEDDSVQFFVRHWSLDTYTRSFRKAGLHLEVSAAMPSSRELMSHRDWWSAYTERPTTAIFKCRHLS